MGTSRATLRRDVGRLLGGMTVLTATSDGAIDGTTFVDSRHLNVQNAALKDRFLYIVTASNAANIGITCRVTGNTASTGTVTFTPALPAQTLAGDVAELWNENGLGLTVEEVHEAINRNIHAVRDSCITPALSDEETFDFSSPFIDIPAEWKFFGRAEWEELDGVWQKVGTADCDCDEVNRIVTIKNLPRRMASGRQVRLRGYTRATTLSDDEDETEVNREWLIHETAAQLLFAVMNRQRTVATESARYTELRRIADATRSAVQETRPIGKFKRLVD